MRVRFPSILALCAVTGCVEDVPIATDCPPERVGRCVVELDADIVVIPSDDDPGERDAGAKTDALVPPDAGPNYVMPPLVNPSFEFASPNNVPGDVTTLTTPFTNIDPWYTCQPLGGQVSNSVTAVRAETGLSKGDTEGAPKVDVAPTDGKTFVTIGYLVNILPFPLLQVLAEPLHPGQRYAFVLDVLATSQAAQLAVELRANNEGCLGPTTQRALFTSDPVTSLTWHPLCVSFTAPTELSRLILATTTTANSVIDPAGMLLEGDVLGGPRLVIDHIRPATRAECPNL
ncbi:MAG TPA: hypothetical protein VI299_25150 [Polyangiales bacterium]